MKNNKKDSKSSKGPKATKVQKDSINIKDSINSPVFTIGELDIILKIDFRDEDLKKKENNSENNEDQYYKLEDLTEIKSLSFLHNNKEVLNRFQLKTNNEMLRLLLIGSQNMEKQTQIDYVCFNIPKFEEEEEFFNDVLDYITKKNGITFNKTALSNNGRFSIKIEMTHKGEKKEINLGSEGVEEHEEDNEIKGEGSSGQDDDYGNDDGEDIEDYEETEAMKKKLIPRFRRKNVLCNLYPQYNKYGMIYFNYEDLNKVPGKYSLDDLFELLEFFKKKNSTIFINYYQQEEIKEEKEEEQEKEKEKEKEKNKKGKKKNDKKDKDRKKENENKENEDNEGPSEEQMNQLNKLYYLTEIYFFDKKQAIKDFDNHYKAFTLDEPKKSINSRNVYDYFIKGVSRGTEEEIPYDKTGLFLDEFNKFIIIQVSKGSVNKQEYDCQPFPKINTHNIDEVNKYKDIIKKNKNDFYCCFLSNMVTSMGGSAPKCINAEVIYPAFLTGVDLVKKKVEFKRNKIKITDDSSFYKIKKHPKVLAQELEKLAKGEKEGKFLLDCTNLITSNKKEYVSLYDYHLKNFFSSQITRKNLKNKGFIDSEGYIMYDPVYRSVMGTNKTNKKKFTKEEMEDKIISNIKDINIHTRLQDKEIIAEKAAFGENVATQKKIPFIKEKPIRKRKKHKNNAGGSGEGSSNSGSSDEENKSKEENNNNQGNEGKVKEEQNNI